MSLLEVKELTKTSAVWPLYPMSISEIEENELVGLIGPNGAGKRPSSIC